MSFFSLQTLVMLVALLGVTVLATPLQRYSPDAPLPGYRVVDLTWVGPLMAGGPNVTLIGPGLEAIETQALALGGTAMSNAPDSSVPDTVTLVDSNPIAPLCWVNAHSGGAHMWAIEDGIKYLRGFGGNAHLDAGPRVCSRVSCSYDSAIWICNDLGKESWVPWSTVADYAYKIRAQCKKTYTNSNGQVDGYCQGQQFDFASSKNWNVLVGSETC